MEEYKTKNLDVNTFFEMTDLIGTISNNPEDYASFYHNYKGKRYRHDQVHNLFGYYMTRSAAEAFERYLPEKRILLFSRASYIGMHRFGGIWQGDNASRPEEPENRKCIAFLTFRSFQVSLEPGINFCHIFIVSI